MRIADSGSYASVNECRQAVKMLTVYDDGHAAHISVWEEAFERVSVFMYKFIFYTFVYESVVGRNTGLSGVEYLAEGSASCGDAYIGALVYYDGAFAAELESYGNVSVSAPRALPFFRQQGSPVKNI